MANSRPRYMNDERMMTEPWSMPAAQLAGLLGHQRHEADQHEPGRKQVGVKDGNAEHGARHIEQRQDRIIEEKRPEHAQRDEALALPVRFAHGPSSAEL